MPKPGADPSSGISLGDVLRLPKRHPACRRREAQSGSWTERENLAGDAKGKAQAAPTARLIVPMRRRGVDRGTDWTRAFAVVNYEQAVEPFLKAARLSDTERATLMGGACAKAYGW